MLLLALVLLGVAITALGAFTGASSSSRGLGVRLAPAFSLKNLADIETGSDSYDSTRRTDGSNSSSGCKAA